MATEEEKKLISEGIELKKELMIALKKEGHSFEEINNCFEEFEIIISEVDKYLKNYMKQEIK